MRLIKVFFILAITLTYTYAKGTGSISVFTFLDGHPLSNTEIIIDEKESYQTDSDGSLEVSLPIGSHNIEIFAKDNNKNNLGYVKKTIVILQDRDTQVIITYFSDKQAPSINIDNPIANKDTNTAIKADFTKAGILNGVVLTTDKNLPIPNARVFVKGTSIDARTDENGRFSVKIPSDVNISISVVHSEYSAQTVDNIVVKKDSSIKTEIRLTPAAMELEEFVVLAPKVTGSIASIIAEEKNSNAITNILGSEEMSKKGDSDAASALKRVTGVTLVGGKSIYVRGLGDRYSNIEMNSMPLPSPDPTKRVVPLDIFPSGVISSMKVQKSATADIPSNFGGGYIDIRTKDKSKDDYVKVSFGLKGNSNTFKDSITQKGGSTDWLGIDDGYRAIDSAIINSSKIVVGQRQEAFTTRYFTKEELIQFTQDYIGDRDYSVTNQKLPMGGSFSIEAARNFEIANKHKITTFFNYKYSQSHSSRYEEKYKYEMDIYTNTLFSNPTQFGFTQHAYSEYTQSGIFNIGYNFNNLFNVKYTKLFTLNGTEGTKITHGKFGSNQDEIYTFYDLQWEERVLNVDQISGNFDYELFSNESNFRFGLESASAELSQPNNYRYYYIQDSSSIDGQPFLSNQNSNHLGINLSSIDIQKAFYLKNKFHFDFLSEEDYIDVGFNLSQKDRESKQHKYFLSYKNTTTTPVNTYTDNIDTIYDTYINSDIAYDDRNLLLATLSQPKDYFDAIVDESNFYLSTFLKPNKNIELLFGARTVNVKQTTYQYKEDSTNPDFNLRRNIIRTANELSINDVYPSISVKYKLDKDNNFDFAYSKTYILPDLREASDGLYTHPYDIADVLGNPELEYTNIDNYDLKYSHYFSDTENVKFGLFYKNLDKPIEDVMMPTSSLPIYSFDNAESAILYGFEVDGRKKLDFIYNKLNNYYLSGNFSYTDSDVTLRDEQLEVYTNNHRQLQGLSQTVVNITISYEIKNRSATLTYNKMGERIRKVGMIEQNGGGLPDSEYPDYMEDPAATLDFVWIEKYSNGLGLKLKLGNILDEETVWFQGDKNHITNSFKKGRKYSASLSYKY